MRYSYVIATILDIREHFDAACEIIHRKYPRVIGIKLTTGPGCLNLGLCINAKSRKIADKDARRICMELQPARYAPASDLPWSGDELTE